MHGTESFIIISNYHLVFLVNHTYVIYIYIYIADLHQNEVISFFFGYLTFSRGACYVSEFAENILLAFFDHSVMLGDSMLSAKYHHMTHCRQNLDGRIQLTLSCSRTLLLNLLNSGHFAVDLSLLQTGHNVCVQL